MYLSDVLPFYMFRELFEVEIYERKKSHTQLGNAGSTFIAEILSSCQVPSSHSLSKFYCHIYVRIKYMIPS